MKLLLTAFCATMITAPLAFADKCDKKKCDKEKEESTLIVEKCKKKCDKEEEESTLLAHCGKCKKGDKKEEKKEEEKEEEGTLA